MLSRVNQRPTEQPWRRRRDRKPIKDDPMQTLVLVAGLLHFCQIPAMIFVEPSMLDWKADLARLQPVNQRIVKVIGLAVVMAVIGLGIVVITSPGELVGGSKLGTALAGFLGVWWSYRFIVQIAVYSRIWPNAPKARLFHYALCVLFAFLASTYSIAFVTALSR